MRYIIGVFVGLVIGAAAMYLWGAGQLPPLGPGTAWLIVPGHDAQNDSVWKLNMRTGALRYCLASAAAAKVVCTVVSDINGPPEVTTKPPAPAP